MIVYHFIIKCQKCGSIYHWSTPVHDPLVLELMSTYPVCRNQRRGEWGGLAPCDYSQEKMEVLRIDMERINGTG